MTSQRLADLHESHPPVVVVAIEDETAQAMVCVALEQIGLQPLAASGLPEAADLTASLPGSPAAMVVMGEPSGARNRLAQVSQAFGARGLKATPTVLLHPPEHQRGEPPHRLPPPDLAGLLRATEALVVGDPPADAD